MYEQFFGFAEAPFNLTPDTRFLFLSGRHREAMVALQYGIIQRKGFLCLTGEIGSGKTTLCRSLLNELHAQNTRAAVIFNSFLTDFELLQSINDEFGLESSVSTKKELIDRLNAFLIEELKAGRTAALIIDEAQNLPPETLEQIRMLGNLESETHKLLQILLVAQPELNEILSDPRMEQLEQRITVRCHLPPLNEEEILHYIRHRLHIAQTKAHIEFTPGALERIGAWTRGIPRKINLLCDRCLLAAYVADSYAINRAIVDKALEDIRGGVPEPAHSPSAPEGDPARAWRERLAANRTTLSVGIVGAVALVGLLAWSLGGPPAEDGAFVSAPAPAKSIAEAASMPASTPAPAPSETILTNAELPPPEAPPEFAPEAGAALTSETAVAPPAPEPAPKPPAIDWTTFVGPPAPGGYTTAADRASTASTKISDANDSGVPKLTAESETGKAKVRAGEPGFKPAPEPELESKAKKTPTPKPEETQKPPEKTPTPKPEETKKPPEKTPAPEPEKAETRPAPTPAETKPAVPTEPPAAAAPSALPRPSPIPFSASAGQPPVPVAANDWVWDKDQIARVNAAEHAFPAAGFTLARLWNRRIDLAAVRQSIARGAPGADLVKEFRRQTQLRFFSMGAEIQAAMQYDLPFMLLVKPRAATESPCLAVIEARASLLTLADPLAGKLQARVEDLRPRIQNVLVFYPDPDNFSDIQPGQDGPAVFALKEFLAGQGWLKSAPDNRYDESLRAGVTAMEIDLGMPASEQLDARVCMRIAMLQNPDYPRLRPARMTVD